MISIIADGGQRGGHEVIEGSVPVKFNDESFGSHRLTSLLGIASGSQSKSIDNTKIRSKAIIHKRPMSRDVAHHLD